MLNETLESINQQLVDLYGIDTVTGLPLWRVVWSEDQFEHRLGTYDDYSPSGIYLRTVTEVRYVPKYRQWISNKYVLENLVVVPEPNRAELPASNISYEPRFPFQDKAGNALPPKIQAAKFVIDMMNAARGDGKVKVYKDPEAGLNSEDLLAQKDEQLKELERELYGNETSVGDALAYQSGIVVPSNYKERN